MAAPRTEALEAICTRTDSVDSTLPTRRRQRHAQPHSPGKPAAAETLRPLKPGAPPQTGTVTLPGTSEGSRRKMHSQDVSVATQPVPCLPRGPLQLQHPGLQQTLQPCWAGAHHNASIQRSAQRNTTRGRHSRSGDRTPVGMTAWEAPGKGRSKASTVTRLCALRATGPPAHGTPAMAALRHFRPQTPFQINRLETPTQEHWGALAESGSVPRGGEPATSTQDPWPDACDMSAPVFISQPGILSFKNLSIRTLFNKSKPSLQALQWAEGAAQSSGCSGMSQTLFS